MKNLLCAIFLFYGFMTSKCDISVRIQKLEIIVKERIAREHEKLKEKLNVIEKNVSDLSGDMFVVKDQERPSEPTEFKNTEYFKQFTSSLEKNLSKRTSAGDVAFHAYLSSSRHYGSHEILIFDRYTVNDKSGYTSVDGIFNVPVTGVYVFTWTIAVPSQGQRIVTELIARGSVIGVLVSDSDKGDLSVSGVHPATAFVVAQVGAGNNVFLRIRSVSIGYGIVLSDDVNVRSTFSAWRLF